MAIYNVYQDICVCVIADSKDEALKKANEAMKNDNYKISNTHVYNEDSRYTSFKNMLAALKKFHGSDCEKEWLDVREAFINEPKSVAYRKLEDFTEKGEYKSYNIRMMNFGIYIFNNDRRDEEEDYDTHEYYGYEGNYNIEKDIKSYEKEIANFDNAIK